MSDVQVGDIVFAHTGTFFGRVIRLGEWIRWRKGAFYNHVCVVNEIRDGIPFVIQAETRGVTDDKPLSTLGQTLVVFPPETVDVDKMLAFYRSQLGKRYGWLTILSIAFNILTPAWLSVRWAWTWVCSAITAEALRAGGWFHDWPDIYQVTPAQLYDAVVTPVVHS